MQMHIRISEGKVTEWVEDDTVPPGSKDAAALTLDERGQDYGDFAEGSEVFAALINAMGLGKRWNDVEGYQLNALVMIAHKLSRLLNGNPDHRDGWHDIAGYASLVERELARRVQEA